MEDNYISPADTLLRDEDVVAEYKANGKLQKGFLPFPTYDMIQCGYPHSDHGEMVPRCFRGSDKDGFLIPPDGMWVKVEDVIEFLKSKNIEF